MPTAIIPSLMSDINRLENPIDIVKYILRWYMHVPKNINDTFNELEISFRYTDAKNGHNKELIANAVRNDLSNVISRYFPTATSDVSTSTSDIDDARYNIVIDIIILLDGKTYSISSSFQIDNDGNLIYAFDGV